MVYIVGDPTFLFKGPIQRRFQKRWPVVGSLGLCGLGPEDEAMLRLVGTEKGYKAGSTSRAYSAARQRLVATL